MSFRYGVALWGLLCVPLAAAAYVLAQRARRRYAVRFTNLDLLASVVSASPRWRRHVPAAFFLAGLAALLVSLARPEATRRVPKQDAGLVLAFDRSRSMLATDVDPTRLEAARTAALKFVDKLPERFKVGLVTFSTNVEVPSAPTTDRALVERSIRTLHPEGGTAMGDGLAQALNLATAGRQDAAQGSKAPPYAIVLLSDGFNTAGAADPLSTAEEAGRLGVPVFTIALGSQTGTVTVEDQFGGTHTVNVPPDHETLQAMAEASGGRYFAAPSQADLDAIYKSLGSRIAFASEREEITAAVAALALVLMVGAAATSLLWFGKLP